MAEIITNNSKRLRKGVRKSQKLSPRVDLTPMVDLGFLLITFFIFTTSMSEPVVLRMALPDDRNVIDSSEVSAERVLTLIASKSDELFYYDGVFTGRLHKTNYKDVRNILVEKKRQVLQTFGSPNLSVLIKATNGATYKNIIDCFDEMVICDVSSYMLLEPDMDELNALNN